MSTSFPSSARVYRGSILHFDHKPSSQGDGMHYFEDGALIVDQGKIITADAFSHLKEAINGLPLEDLSGQLLLPGLIDTHIHFPQIDVIGSYGEQLLDWLNQYTFPAEMRYSNKQYAQQSAEAFLNTLFRCGTTTAMVYCTVHPESVDAFFEISQRYHSRMIAGKVLMDRNAPDALLDNAGGGVKDSEALIDRWHNNGRQLYAITPRFAPTSTPNQLMATGELLKNNPSVYLQTHLAENHDEIAWVASLFPEQSDYFGVYEHYGLTGEKCTFGHGIHLTDSALERMADSGSRIAFCPTSNLFLGSGLLDWQRAQSAGVSVSIASDVGAGTSFCQLKTLGDAYKIGQLQNAALHPYEAFYWLTLGNAKSLQLDHCLGNFYSGKEADFIAIDLAATPLMAHRASQCNNLYEKLFLLMTFGDDRAISQTWVNGNRVYKRGDENSIVLNTL